MRADIWIVLAAVGCSATVLGCGSGQGSSAGRINTGQRADVRFADCMRAHGVPNFPDPLPGGGFPRGSTGPQSPASRAAQQICVPILKPGSGTRHKPSSAALAAAVRYSRCMRSHGVPGFPDPVTSLTSPNVNVIVDGGILFPLGSSVDPQAPAFQRAATTCGGPPRVGQPRGG